MTDTMYNELCKRIRDLAVKIAPDYPGIRSTGPFEQLHAIEMAYGGMKNALSDCNTMISVLMLRNGMSEDEFLVLWKNTLCSQERIKQY